MENPLQARHIRQLPRPALGLGRGTIAGSFHLHPSFPLAGAGPLAAAIRCLAILGLLALAACAARPPRGPSPYTTGYRPPRDENFNGGPNAMLLKYAGPDGSLTRARMNAGLKADFDKFDTRHAGCLDSDQVAAINAARIADDQSTASPLQDWNQDGCIDLREFSTAANSLFDQLDVNNDGTITAREFNPRAPGAAGAPAAVGQGGGRGRRGGEGGGQGDPPP